MRRTICFVHKGQIRELVPREPTQTVLNFLRYEDALTGTKEGCAEGDCGACTVVLGDLELDGSIRYLAVNSCIQFLPMLDGRELITAEDLKLADGSLHPIQQAMVDHNATQCGFCTPGFVMSLFAEKHGSNSADTWDVNNVLAGNLCRCTGYGTIIAAAKSAAASHADDQFDGTMETRAGMLKSLQQNPPLALQAKGNRYFAPTSIAELADLLATYPQAILLAGATDIGLWVTKQHRQLDTLIYLGRIQTLKAMVLDENSISIGAGVTYAEAWKTLGSEYADLHELIRRIGSTQIRNSATICGNIANGSPIGDMPPALIALDATVTLTSKRGSRSIALEKFFIGYNTQDLHLGEFVEKVSIPRPSATKQFRVYKISKRFDQDISALCAAFNLTLAGITVKDIRICYGGMAGTPLRAQQTEAAVIGKDWVRATIDTALQAMSKDYQPLSDMRASDRYRMAVAQNLLLKFFIETTDRHTATRLLGDMERAHA